MALIICATHGESSVAFTSPAVATAVIRNEAPLWRTVQLILEVERDKGSGHLVDVEFAESVRSRLNLGEEPILVPQGEPSFDVLCDLKPVCQRCFEAWQRTYC